MNPTVLDLARISGGNQRELGSVSELRNIRPSAHQEVMPFEEMLTSSMRQVNRLQLEADDMVRRLAVGDVDDISEVVLASSRAEIASRMLMELRNQFVDAYQQLSRISG